MEYARFDKAEKILYINNRTGIPLTEVAGVSLELLSQNPHPNLLILETTHFGLNVNPARESQRIIDFVTRLSCRYNFIRHAVVSENAVVVAHVLYAREKLSHGNYHIDVFVTEQAAKNWLSQ